MDDEPLPRPVVGARLPGAALLGLLGLLTLPVLVVLLVGLEQVGVGRQLAGLLHQGPGAVRLGRLLGGGDAGLVFRLGGEGVFLAQVAGVFEGIRGVGGHGLS